LNLVLCLLDSNEFFAKLAVGHASRSFNQRMSGKLLAADR
jgi:hypothetical protein